MKPFGENLAALMKRERLSARDLARLLQVSSKTVDEWIGAKGRVPRNPEYIRRLAEHFGVSTHFLLFGEEDPRTILGDVLEKSEIHSGLYEITLKRVHRNHSLEEKK